MYSFVEMRIMEYIQCTECLSHPGPWLWNWISISSHWGCDNTYSYRTYIMATSGLSILMTHGQWSINQRDIKMLWCCEMKSFQRNIKMVLVMWFNLRLPVIYFLSEFWIPSNLWSITWASRCIWKCLVYRRKKIHARD